MKRKRFVKLAMSYGLQRNEAERLAKLVCVYGSYEALFAAQHFGLEIERVKMAFRRFAAEIVRIMRPVAEKLAAILGGIDWAAVLAAEDEGGEEAAETEE